MTANVKVMHDFSVYVDDSRITGGGTKFGPKRTLVEFLWPKESLVSELINMGFNKHVKLIDTEPYLTQVREKYQ